jgi:hypothetical protein
MPMTPSGMRSATELVACVPAQVASCIGSVSRPSAPVKPTGGGDFSGGTGMMHGQPACA